jgi:hypothetical protein
LPIHTCCVDPIVIDTIGVTVAIVAKTLPTGLDGICLEKQLTPAVVDQHLKRGEVRALHCEQIIYTIKVWGKATGYDELRVEWL